jgi:hypothetical protein
MCQEDKFYNKDRRILGGSAKQGSAIASRQTS